MIMMKGFASAGLVVWAALAIARAQAEPIRPSWWGNKSPGRGEAILTMPANPDDALTTTVFHWRDGVERLAVTCGMSPADLLRLNRLDASELSDGQVLLVPVPRALPPPSSPRARPFDPAVQRAREIWRGVRGRNRIALTFDAGGDRDHASDLLAALREAGIQSSFFVTGDFCRRHPDIVQAIAADGHPIHNHSWSHPDLRTLSADAIRSELERTDARVLELTGRSTRPFFRPPFGERDARVLREAAAAGFQSVYWTLDSLDAYGEEKTADAVVRRVLHPPAGGDNPARFLDGAIILFHVGKRGTAEAIPRLAANLRAYGLQFATVEEIVNP
ncbi:MAG: polysaccharide deacetylase family protein [Candidatus Sumerlaeaceae bacterium]|nr:polysaccharide deacetylase family protein [Candidatus Sumerlaeaceae bacterium]